MPEHHPNPTYYTQTINSVCADLGGDPERRLTIQDVERGLFGLVKDEPADATLGGPSPGAKHRNLSRRGAVFTGTPRRR